MRGSVMTLFCLLRGAVMLNIRVNFTIDVKKVARVASAILIVWSQVLSPAAQATPISVPKFKMAYEEKDVSVALNNVNLKVTRSGAKEALSSPYVKYFDPQTIAFLTEYASGKSMADWKCLNNLWTSESHFNPKALNMSSHAFGIAQFLPSTWGNYNLTKTPVALLQIKYGLHYIDKRYGSVCNAWTFWKKHSWY